MAQITSPRAFRYATDPEYRARIRASQTVRYATSEEFRQAALRRSTDRRKALQHSRKEVRDSWLQSEEYRASMAAWTERKKSEACARSSAWYEENKDRTVSGQSRRREKNPGRQAHWSNMHRAKKLACVPPWVDEYAVLYVYWVAAHMRAVTGAELHVDHIVPLNHPLVCGLHCQFNLQVTTARHNYTKGNRLWPNMPGAAE